MNIYDALIKTAELFEQRPGLYDFGRIRVPTDCGTPGCVLGWVGYFAGMSGLVGDVAVQLIGKNRFRSGGAFYKRMNELCPEGGWTSDAAIAAKTIRAYAEKYHSDEKHEGIPAHVRAIFEEKVATCDKLEVAK